ncbi:MAG: nucleotidyltransferase domain-containing protein [Desulfovermiculus sp.]|nr:nucleotidyltransferase domain-containing protein [Desulfovermiculus sp.]
MRLSTTEQQAIKDAVFSADPQARIYLFGSRVDDTKRGGDIDLLIFYPKITFKDKLDIKAKIFDKMDEQKIDLLIATDTQDPFVRLALKNSVELT